MVNAAKAYHQTAWNTLALVLFAIASGATVVLLALSLVQQ
jgi:hypothetical protein